MATYAAFKHIELSKLGTSKKRVMKPSGGGNSDIFCSESLEEVPRSTKNHMRSSIFSEPENIGKNGDLRSVKGSSHNRLFGTPEHVVSSNPIVKSNIFGKVDEADNKNEILSNGVNPGTGEGYKPAGAEINTQVPALNGNHILRNRIPPGGFSSGLW